MKTHIEIKDLRKTYVSRKTSTIEAIKSIDLQINTGEFVAVVGPSGCGKSTLLSLIGGLLKPTSGRISIKNQSVEHARLHKEFGYVFQKPSLLPWRTVLENVCLPLEIINKNSSKSNNTTRAEDILKKVDLFQYKDNLPSELSGGMQQRVAIARALVFNPNILLMDEPFSALDEITRDKMNLDLLKLWKKLNQTIVYVTHSITEAVFLAEKVIVLSKRPAIIKKQFSVDLEKSSKVRYSKAFNNIVKNIHLVLQE
jgi:NitT/TauT family transport system ATP-binding protein